MRHHYRIQFPAVNIPRWNDDVATNTLFSSVPVHDDGIDGHGGTTMAQLFCGVTSLVLTDIFPLKDESNIVGTFEDLI
jgi:hypothetical protein